ncbi:protochlorophyllide oxidoreductase [Saccharomonospora piscinae]|uniref:Protochlorophyllide oxidoreductase n=1 Tax=Saccharomonospora piscinae TaxID=687388 RepID=A0A1V8ZWP7_SACPI|nr:oxidoreductase [Saccharomonospora piscinae]OQO89292.1 protochlorophyllide oxidoreductase [Saccharomonospora piscinae]TLW90980.1 SDR family NAD(P)-dependent oxidoreductase [Saccharomonospora piscinae]
MSRSSSAWTEADIPDQSGRTVLVTGANSGLGLHTARVLAARGATVLLACRDAGRGQRALAAVRTVARAEPALVSCDLASLDSVRRCAERARELTDDRLDVLISNAGIMAPPRTETADGFEAQFATNHLGHAALTWLLMPALRRGTEARVVTVASLVGHRGRLDLADPHFHRRRYNPATAYAQSKLANIVFAQELQRRLTDAGSTVRSVAAHPGYTRTGLTTAMAGAYAQPLVRAVMSAGARIGDLALGQPARTGTLPQLYAATAPDVRGGDYLGPHGPGGVRGYPTRVRVPRRALDPHTGRGLWELTADLTRVTPDPA